MLLAAVKEHTIHNAVLPVVLCGCETWSLTLRDERRFKVFENRVKSRRMRWAGHVARMGEGRGMHRVLVGKPEGKRPLGKPIRRWGDNIKMDLQEVGGSCGDWMELLRIGTGGGRLWVR